MYIKMYALKKKRNVHPFVFKREVTNKLPWEKLTKREVEIVWNNFTLKIYQNLDTLNWDEKGLTNMLSKKHAYTKKVKKKGFPSDSENFFAIIKIKSFHINVFIMIPKSFYWIISCKGNLNFCETFKFYDLMQANFLDKIYLKLQLS